MTDRLADIKAAGHMKWEADDIDWLIAEVGRLKGDVEYGAGEWHQEGIATGMEQAAVIAEKHDWASSTQNDLDIAGSSIAAAIRKDIKT